MSILQSNVPTPEEEYEVEAWLDTLTSLQPKLAIRADFRLNTSIDELEQVHISLMSVVYCVHVAGTGTCTYTRHDVSVVSACSHAIAYGIMSHLSACMVIVPHTTDWTVLACV
jgi:hypothetical protein